MDRDAFGSEHSPSADFSEAKAINHSMEVIIRL
jgi:hypothetical protein